MLLDSSCLRAAVDTSCAMVVAIAMRHWDLPIRPSVRFTVGVSMVGRPLLSEKTLINVNPPKRALHLSASNIKRAQAGHVEGPKRHV
jgi:hypothetical protein